jgi:RNA exonuclease 1
LRRIVAKALDSVPLAVGFDTEVALSEPNPAQDKSTYDSFTQGLQVYALDCEMVLTTDDVYSLARISILDWDGKVVLDKIVRPALPVKDYFTQFSGITEKLLEGVTTTLEDIQKDLFRLCGPATILLGHSLESDFNALKMTHPFIVDTSLLYPHPRGLPLRSSLKFLANKYLKREIQKGGESGHDSVEDARAVLDLVKLKCEKGPKWGTVDANGESIFARLNASGCRTAIVDYGTPEKGLGRLATIHVGCQNDVQITDAVVRLTNTQDGADKTKFVWGRLREMEMARGWNSAKEQYTTPSTVRQDARADGPVNGPETQELNASEAKGIENGDTRTALEMAAHGTVANLVRVYASLAPSTLFVVFSGPGDMREVLRLQDMQKQYKKEFKVKKWDELSVKWTDDEVQALRKAFEQARNGWGLVCLK